MLNNVDVALPLSKSSTFHLTRSLALYRFQKWRSARVEASRVAPQSEEWAAALLVRAMSAWQEGLKDEANRDFASAFARLRSRNRNLEALAMYREAAELLGKSSGALLVSGQSPVIGPI
jgi:hypothetical protein